ncbi:MAG: tetrahydromethanopterin S-methyltransferase subunit A [Candidatus Lokiarchaeota archaeon]|nr:tetrahydromethanopterin S-methyltransferase subunit A [Candidatus Lokiarchaeota archaeon]
MSEKKWPPVPGDFEVKDSEGSIAVCTLGKKIDVDAEYSIIGTCKTENIGIERVIVNIVSNNNIRFFILAGPEVPGHLTGSSIRCLHENGVDSSTRKIIDAPGAIPYIENIPMEAIERFRDQVEFIDMMNVSDPIKIAEKVRELSQIKIDAYQEAPIWIEFKGDAAKKRAQHLRGSVAMVPEYDIELEPFTSLIGGSNPLVITCTHPSRVGIEIQSLETGTIMVAKELD